MIRNQVELPFKLSLSIVMQGIRIRMGRSMVTLMGIVLGIAFLMANMTSQIVRTGVAQEDQLRTGIKRMVSFLTAEMGPVRGKTVGLIQLGPLSTEEARLLMQLADGGLARLNWAGARRDEKLTLPAGFVQACTPQEAAAGAGALLVMGQGDAPPAWDALGAQLDMRPLAFTRAEVDLKTLPAQVRNAVSLATPLPPEELAKARQDQRKNKFRGVWIMIISILVTVMGITNAMLMSVTERFREIGTMKCLGAKSSFVRRLFLIESCLLGLVGAAAGTAMGIVFSLVMHAFMYGALLLHALNLPLIAAAAAACVAAGVLLSIVAAIYPASVAAAMTPAHALRSNV